MGVLITMVPLIAAHSPHHPLMLLSALWLKDSSSEFLAKDLQNFAKTQFVFLKCEEEQKTVILYGEM